MTELRLVKSGHKLGSKRQQDLAKKRQELRKRIASVLHILITEIEACGLTLAEEAEWEVNPRDKSEVVEKATGLMSLAHLIGMLEPDFVSVEYASYPKPFSAATVNWMNSSARHAKIDK